MLGAALAALPGALVAASAAEFDASLDVRLVDSNAARSFLEGGLGPLRYGENQSGIQLGRLRLALTAPFWDIVTLHLDASSWGHPERNPIDLTEGYLQLRPYPRAGMRARLKAGAFYAPVSLENRAPGWESPYTLSNSALDSWVAEELRTIGLEAQLEWLGSRLGYSTDVALVAGVFGWNEPAGVALATHGFAINDRQSTLNGVVGEPGAGPVHGFELFREIDGRAGNYFGAELKYLNRVTVRGLHYDNHADPAAYDAAIGEHAWSTRFDTLGARAEGQAGWTAIAQWMQGVTRVAPAGVGVLEWYFDTRYLLLSQRWGAHLVSVRYDDFEVMPQPPLEAGAQHGHAVTLAYGYSPGPHWRLMLEGVRVRSAQSNRALFLGEAPLATDSALQLSVRYSLDPG